MKVPVKVPVKVAVSGASGLVGSALVPQLTASGHDVARLVRRAPRGADEIPWDPAAGELEATALCGVDAVVHLAGESIASGRWTAAQKERILRSRVDGTRLLATAIAALEPPPAVFLCASAVGYYGDRGAELLDETSAPGDNFLAEVCVRWEAAADPARERGVRVVHLRLGVVLSRRGGALAKMLLPFRLGLGGVVGSGEQYLSWIALADLVAVIVRALEHDDLAGAVNAVAPSPVTNREFTKTLGKVLGRPTVLPVPAPLLRLALGEMADELLLASARVTPARLAAAGFRWRAPEIEAGLRQALSESES